MSAQTLYVFGLVSYDGTEYHGYQVQVGVPTIQGELEDALSRFCEPQGRIAAAGRTDAGVHANGQVIAVKLHWRHGAKQIQNAWNAHLPDAICVRGLKEITEDFHPRFSALERTYRYRLVQHLQCSETLSGRLPLTDRFEWYMPHKLDMVRMQQAADELVGAIDFATFGQPTQGESTVRSVSQASWQVDERSISDLDSYPARHLVFTITANGFLRQMVRTITGTLVEVGLGKRQPEDMAELLESRDRSLSAPPAPACGLTLVKVTYPEQFSVFGS